MIDNLILWFDDERMNSYDRINNPDRLSIWQLTEDGFSWMYQGKRFVRRFKKKGDARIVQGGAAIAVVELSTHVDDCFAYFIDGRGTLLCAAAIPDELKSQRPKPFGLFLVEDGVDIQYSATVGYRDDYHVTYSAADFSIRTFSRFR